MYIKESQKVANENWSLVLTEHNLSIDWNLKVQI